MSRREIDKVCFVGAGAMGSYNSLIAALAGYQASVYDVDGAALDRVPEAQTEYGAFLVGSGFCDQEELVRARTRVDLQHSLAAATAEADLVSESVVERLDVKRSVHRELDALCHARAIITTNTSALSVSEIESAVKRGDRFAALHSHLGSPLVDIVAGPRTSAATVSTLLDYTQSIRGVPLLLKKEHPGYVLNALLGPLLSTAMLMRSHDMASLQDLDRAWMHFRRAPMGPFGMMDLFGIGLIYDSWKHRDVPPESEDARRRVLSLLTPYLDRMDVGMKSGKGFYDYPNPDYRSSEFLDSAASLSPLHDVLTSAVIANAVHLSQLKVADPQQIDMAWKVGTHLDVGPFEILQRMDSAALRESIATLIDLDLIDQDRQRSMTAFEQLAC